MDVAVEHGSGLRKQGHRRRYSDWVMPCSSPAPLSGMKAPVARCFECPAAPSVDPVFRHLIRYKKQSGRWDDRYWGFSTVIFEAEGSRGPGLARWESMFHSRYHRGVRAEPVVRSMVVLQHGYAMERGLAFQLRLLVYSVLDVPQRLCACRGDGPVTSVGRLDRGCCVRASNVPCLSCL